MSTINITSEHLKARKSLFLSILIFYENFLSLTLSDSGKSYIYRYMMQQNFKYSKGYSREKLWGGGGGVVTFSWNRLK